MPELEYLLMQVCRTVSLVLPTIFQESCLFIMNGMPTDTYLFFEKCCCFLIGKCFFPLLVLCKTQRKTSKKALKVKQGLRSSVLRGEDLSCIWHKRRAQQNSCGRRGCQIPRLSVLASVWIRPV